MGRSKQVTFNVNDLFLEGQNDAGTRADFIRSPLFGIAVNAYNRAKSMNLGLRVGNIVRKESAWDGRVISVIHQVNLVTPVGVPVASIINLGSSSYNNIRFGTYTSHTEGTAYGQLTSSNPKYVQSKLSVKSEHDAADAFDSALKSAHNFFENKFRELADTLVDEASGDRHVRRPLVKGNVLQDEVITFLVKVYAGDCTFAEMPMTMRSDLDAEMKRYRERCVNFDNAVAKALEFMDGDKWVFMPGMNNGVVVACVSPDGVVEGLNRYLKTGNLPYVPELKFAPMAIEPKWYPSFESLPDYIREGLQFSMIMLKTHLNSQDMLPKDCPGGRFFMEMGCHSHSAWNSEGADVHILSR